eukprot:4466661-Amphidinium_carterae.1
MPRSMLLDYAQRTHVESELARKRDVTETSAADPPCTRNHPFQRGGQGQVVRGIDEEWIINSEVQQLT